MLDRHMHQEIHKELHQALDRLVADFIMHTKKMPRGTTVMELMEWSSKQVDDPQSR